MPTSRLNHWRSLLQARAIENDIFIVACNGTGHDGNTEYAGHSMVINPNGDILVELNREEATISVDINIQEVSRQRDAIPIFRNLKPHLYKKSRELGRDSRLLLKGMFYSYFSIFWGCY